MHRICKFNLGMQWNCLSDYLGCNGFARLTGRDTTDLPNRISGFFKDRVLISSTGTGTYLCRLIVFQKYKNFKCFSRDGAPTHFTWAGKKLASNFCRIRIQYAKICKELLGLLVLYLFSLLKNKLKQELKPIKLWILYHPFFLLTVWKEFRI